MNNFMPSCQCNQCLYGGDVISVQNSIIDKIFIDKNLGFVTISYGLIGHFGLIHIEHVTLVITQDTILQDTSGRDLILTDLREGMSIDADFSSSMTFSIPLHSRAYRIIVANPQLAYDVTVGRVLTVDLQNGFLYTGNANDLLSQIRFVITNTTLILDRNGYNIPLINIKPGQLVRIEHSIYQTFSIPPQMTAFVVQII